MAVKAYYQRLLDPRWQKKRLEVMTASDWKCELCGDGSQTLHVHHKEYFKGKEPWDYERNQLACLCETCHENQHSSADLLKLICSQLPLDGPYCRADAAYLLAGFAGIKADFLCPGHESLYNFGRLAAKQYWGDHEN